MNEIGNICLFNVVLFTLGWVTGFARQFEDLWKIMPECIGTFLVIGLTCKALSYSSSRKTAKAAQQKDALDGE